MLSLKFLPPVLFCFTILFLHSCKSRDASYTGVKIDREISPQIIDLNLFIYRPSDMVIIDQTLVIHDKYEKSLFKFYDLNDFSNSISWGEQGEGPDKIKFVSYNSLSKTSRGFGFVDKYTFRQFEIGENLKLNESHPIKLSHDLGVLNGFCWLNDNLFIVNSMTNDVTDNSEHVFLKGAAMVGSEFGSYPYEKIEYGGYLEKQRYYSKFGLADENKGILFIFYYKQNLIKMYNYEGQLLKEKSLEFEEILNKDEKALSFMTGTHNKNFLFLINPNKIQKDLKNDPENYHPNLLVMDWDGNLVAKFKINEPLELISVTDDNQVYGMAGEVGDKLYLYNLNSFLN